jgi:hypothetical protein
MGQYLKIPPRVLFSAQLWGAIVGAIVNYVVMTSIVSSQRAVLLDPLGMERSDRSLDGGATPQEM